MYKLLERGGERVAAGYTDDEKMFEREKL